MSSSFKPDPPVVGKVTHHSVELFWTHIKEKVGANVRVRYALQEADKNKHEWGNVYSGYGVTKIIDGLEPTTEYSFRISFTLPDNQKSEYSQICTVRTTSNLLKEIFPKFGFSFLFNIEEPITGEALHKAINLNRKTEIETILQSPDAYKLIEVPDKYGNFPLMNAVLKDNLEYVYKNFLI
jgi:fibronectin type 3 and ankyrin repeat domains protein 1